MQVKEFLQKYGERVGIKDITTLYRHIWLNDDRLVKDGIIEIHRVFTREFIDIKDPEKLVKFLDEIRIRRLKEKRDNYYHRNKRLQERADEKAKELAGATTTDG